MLKFAPYYRFSANLIKVGDSIDYPTYNLIKMQCKSNKIPDLVEYLKERKQGLVVNFKLLELPITTNGLAALFANLKTASDIEKFAQKYGLLGRVEEKYNNEFYRTYGRSAFEPLELWFEEINKVRKLMSLYKAICKRRKGYEESEIEGNLLEFHYIEDRVWIYWKGDYEKEDPELPWSTHCLLTCDEEDFKEAFNFDEGVSAWVLAKSIENALEGGMTISFSDIIFTNKSNIGFRISEVHKTQSLLAVIYYDLLRLITDNQEVSLCPICGLPFEPVKRQEYCTAACRQAAYRRRKKP